jgi:hypothetical protein
MDILDYILKYLVQYVTRIAILSSRHFSIFFLPNTRRLSGGNSGPAFAVVPASSLNWEGLMKPIAILGIVLIVLGVAGLFFSRVTWTETKPVVKLGPLEVNSQEDHTVWIPTAAGAIAVLAGIGLVFAGKRTA